MRMFLERKYQKPSKIPIVLSSSPSFKTSQLPKRPIQAVVPVPPPLVFSALSPLPLAFSLSLLHTLLLFLPLLLLNPTLPHHFLRNRIGPSSHVDRIAPLLVPLPVTMSAASLSSSINVIRSASFGSDKSALFSNARPSSSSAFLGSSAKLRFNPLRSSVVAAAAASNVVKEKQPKSSPSGSHLLITKEEGLELYEDMVLGRSFEDMCAQMYYRGKMFGFVHLYNGQEAVSTGFIKLLKQEDSVVSTYRDHVHALSKGVPARQVMSELFGKETGCCRGQGGSMHMFSKEHNLIGGFAFIGEGIPIATGAAFTSKYRREVLKEEGCDHVTVAFFGDGTANNGQFFECLNMAQLWKLPIIFVVENNLWAIGMSHIRATSDPQIWKKGPAFGMPGVHVDGMDVLKVREVAKEAVGRARRGEGPTLVECETYRFRGHSLADPDELREPGEHFKTNLDCHS